MKTIAAFVVLALPPMAAFALYFAGAFTGPLQLLQPLPFAWLAASVGLWLLASLVLGLKPRPRPGARPWSAVSKLFHWIMALAVLGTTALMYYIVNLGDLNDPPVRAEYSRLFRLHKSLGLIALSLVAFRFAWNRTRERPQLPGGMSSAQRRLAALTHGMLYAGLLFVPLIGWMASMTYGGRTHFFGLVELPVWLPKNEAWAAILQPAHIYLAWGLLGLVGLHVAAALWHHFVRRDATLVQMLPHTPRI